MRQKWVTHASTRESVSTLEDEAILLMDIQLDDYLYLHQREYIKLYEALANTYGLATVGIFVIFVLFAPVINTNYMASLMNHLYDNKESTIHINL